MKAPFYALLLPLFLSASGCTQPAKASAPLPPPPEVEVTTVKQRDVPVYGEYVGSLDGFINADVKPQVAGYILRRTYHEGGLVKKGQLLFEIDPRPSQAALDQAQGQLKQSRGQFVQAEGQLAQAIAGVVTAEKNLEQYLAALEQARSQLSQNLALRAQSAANATKAKLDLEKYIPMRAAQAATQQDLDNARQTDQAAAAQVWASDAQVASSYANITSAGAQVASARSAVKAAQAQVITGQGTLKTSMGQVQAAQAQVDTAEVNLKFTRVISPVTGIAGVAGAERGNLVSNLTSTALVTVSVVDPIKALFTIPEQDYIASQDRQHTIKGREEANRRLRFQLILSDGSIYSWPGRFYSIDRNLSLNTGAIKITAIFPNPERTLRPGQFARIRTLKYIHRKALLIPQRAVTEIQDRNQVAVVGKDNKIELRSVQLGDVEGADWLIKSGLKPGETIVVEGASGAAVNTVVKPKPYQATPTPAETPK